MVRYYFEFIQGTCHLTSPVFHNTAILCCDIEYKLIIVMHTLFGTT